jgi:hypothetical protein
MDNMGQNVGEVLNDFVEEHNVELPEGSVMTPVAVDMRGAVDDGRITFSATAKPVVGVIYYHRAGKQFLYNFRVEPFGFTPSKPGRPNGQIGGNGSVHPFQIRSIGCPTCGAKFEMDRKEEDYSKSQDSFYCFRCMKTEIAKLAEEWFGAATDDKHRESLQAQARQRLISAPEVQELRKELKLRHRLKLLGNIVPAADPSVADRLGQVSNAPTPHDEDILPRFYGVFRKDCVPTIWEPGTPLEREVSDRLVKSPTGAKAIRPMSELLKMSGIIPGILEIIGIARPVAVGWVSEASLRLEREDLGYKRLFPIDDAGYRHARRVAEPRFKREDALV